MNWQRTISVLVLRNLIHNSIERYPVVALWRNNYMNHQDHTVGCINRRCHYFVLFFRMIDSLIGAPFDFISHYYSLIFILFVIFFYTFYACSCCFQGLTEFSFCLIYFLFYRKCLYCISPWKMYTILYLYDFEPTSLLYLCPLLNKLKFCSFASV